MYIFFLLFVFVLPVISSNVCDSLCVCRYSNVVNQDYLGESIDCSYKEPTILNNSHDLPIIVHSLDLSANKITTIHSSSLLQSKTLTELYLNNNLITEITLDAFQLPELRKLDLSENLLDTIHSDTFKNVKKLESINFANNRFTTFYKLTFHHLSNLNEIVLDHNDLGRSLENGNLFDRSGYGLTNKIRSLSIKGINHNVVPDNFFVDAYDIRKLIISDNNITDVFELPFTLEYLDLSDNPISYISGEDFVDLRGLKELKLNNLRIKEVPEYVFASLHSLIKLELERNSYLVEFDPLAFGQEVLFDPEDFVLEKLSLRGSRLSTLDKSLLTPFGQLSKLDLQGNPWRCDCNLLWLKQLQISPQDYNHLRCFSPTPLYNARVFELKNKFFSCSTSKPHVASTLAIITLCVVLSTLAIWIFIFLPKQVTRCHLLRQMYNPSTAYSVLPMVAGGAHVADL